MRVGIHGESSFNHGDGGELDECLYAIHWFREEGGRSSPAPARRRLHLLTHDFKPGWDTYIEGEGHGLEEDPAFDQERAEDYDEPPSRRQGARAIC